MTGVLVLWSGGVDSTLLVKRALDEEQLGLPVFVAYGQPASAQESAACRQLGNHWRIEWQRLYLALRGMDAMATGYRQPGPRILPGRNQIMISHAVNIAAAAQLGEVWIGATAGDRADYADCRPGFIAAMDELAQAWGVRVRAPLLDMSRADVVQECRDRSVPLELCWSCYQPRGIDPCGECNSCRQEKP